MLDVSSPAVQKAVPAKSSLLVLRKFWPVNGSTEDIASLDGLRGIAVLSVMFMHIPLVMMLSKPQENTNWLNQTSSFWNFGATGVQLFFVLSGFLLFLPYSQALLGLKPFPSTRKFYTRRALRILPAYWVSLLLIVAVSQQHFLSFLKASNDVRGSDVILHLFLIQNWSFDTIERINGPFWTMAVESQFYLLLPLMAGLLYKLLQAKRYRVLMAVLVVGFLISFAYSLLDLLTSSSALHDHITLLYVFNYLIVFEIGMLFSFLYVAAKKGPATMRKLPLNNSKVTLLIGLAGVSLLVLDLLLSALLNPDNPLFLDFGANLLLGLGYGCLLLCAVISKSWWAYFLAHPVMRFIGVISYSLYIWNWVIYEKVIEKIVGTSKSDWLTILLFLMLTVGILIPFCYLFYQFVERPFINLRRKQH